jgi:cytoskeletal protein CcmA (bactofilin family)
MPRKEHDMFGKSKNTSPGNNQVPSSSQQLERSPVAVSEARESADELSSISSDITIVGKIIGKGTVKISGRIEGELHASILLISDGARVEGDIVAKEVTIGGCVKGTIHADRVKLTSSAVVEGDIFHRTLSIEENAHFEGSSRREEAVIDGTRLPLSQPIAGAEIHTLAAMEANQKNNGLLDNKWHATE